MNAISLRGGPSGPTLTGGSTGDVVTKNADGTVSFQPGGGGGGSTSDDVTNLSLVAGASVTDALDTIFTDPSFRSENAIGASGASKSVSLVNGPAQSMVLTANCAISFAGGFPSSQTAWLQLKLIQDATGGRTITLPSTKRPGGVALTLSSAPNAVDIINVYWDGSTAYATVGGLAFS